MRQSYSQFLQAFPSKAFRIPARAAIDDRLLKIQRTKRMKGEPRFRCCRRAASCPFGCGSDVSYDLAHYRRRVIRAILFLRVLRQVYDQEWVCSPTSFTSNLLHHSFGRLKSSICSSLNIFTLLLECKGLNSIVSKLSSFECKHQVALSTRVLCYCLGDWNDPIRFHHFIAWRLFIMSSCRYVDTRVSGQ